MKKIIAGIAALLIALSAGTTGVLAAGSGNGAGLAKQAGTRSLSCRLLDGAAQRYAGNAPAGCRFTDADNDGICDFCGLGICRDGNYVDENNDGICDLCGGLGVCRGGNYTDEDNDGICDNWQSSRPLDGTGRQRGCRGGRRG